MEIICRLYFILNFPNLPCQLHKFALKMLTIVKDYKGSEILLYWKANELVCYSVKNSGRKHETLVLETKDLLLPS